MFSFKQILPVLFLFATVCLLIDFFVGSRKPTITNLFGIRWSFKTNDIHSIESNINGFGRMMSNMRRLSCVYRKIKRIREHLGYDPIGRYLGRDSLLMEINRRKKLRDARIKRK